MEDKQGSERSTVLNGVAKVLNSGGSAVVYAYDFTSVGVGKMYEMMKKVPGKSGKVIDLFSRGFDFAKPSEKRRLKEKVREYEAKIKQLYYEIGKEGASHPGDEIALGTEPIKNLLSEVREYEKEIDRLQNRMIEIEEQIKADAAMRKQRRQRAPRLEKKAGMTDEKITKSLESAVEKAVKQSNIASPSEQEIFSKVVNDMLDSDTEIKILAAGELGKIGNEAAVPVLVAAAGFGDTDLNSEIMNSLIMIGSTDALPLFFDQVADPSHRIRIVCLRGIYKLAEDEDALPVLIEALQDANSEVRRTAATFIGWKDYPDSGPALAQCLRDEDARVRKAAVSALSNLKDDSTVLPLINVLGDKEMELREKALETISILVGEDVSFDLHASRSELNDAIAELKDWWQKERLGEIDITDADDADDTEAPMEALGEETAEAEVVEVVDDDVETPMEAEMAEVDVEAEADAETPMEAEMAEVDVEAEADAEAPTEALGEETPEAETVDMEAAEDTETAEAEAAAEDGIGTDLAEDTELDLELMSDDMQAMAEAEANNIAAGGEADEVPADGSGMESASEGEEDQSTSADSGDGSEYTQEGLMKMLKSELLDIAKSLEIDANDTLTKAEISDLILGK